MDIKYKILELDNNEKYIVADSITYSSRTFLYLGKLNDLEDDVSEEFELYELLNGEGSSRIEKVSDENLKSVLDMIFKTQNQ